MGVRKQESKREEVVVAVAIDKDKGSEYAIKWIAETLLTRPGQALTLVHVNQSPTHLPNQSGQLRMVNNPQIDNQGKDMFLPFRCFCTKKAIQCSEVIIQDTDIAKAIISYVSANQIEVLVLGAPSKSTLSFFRLRTRDVPSIVSKGVPDFCTVYVIGKGKITHSRPATTSAPQKITHNNQIQHPLRHIYDPYGSNHSRGSERSQLSENKYRSTLTRASPIRNKSYEPLDFDTSSVSSGRPSVDHTFTFDSLMSKLTHQSSNSSELESRSSMYSGIRFIDMTSAPSGFSTSSVESGRSWSSQQKDDTEAEMRRLRLELKQTMEMYSMACKEAVTAKHKEKELHQWKLNGENRLEEARLAEEAAVKLAEKEKVKSRAAIEAAKAAERIAVMESEKRRNTEIKALRKAEGRKKSLESKACALRYRQYTIEDIELATNHFSQANKIGGGGYGPVFRGELDHTPVAIKVLRPDAAHGRSQFQQEVEVLSCIRHPNMVLLLGACSQYGCLVYEYMANGSLEDRLFRKGNTPIIPWQFRFRIAAEIATGLLFLHQAKPEPVVHRDLKPANILLDNNYVSKISDVGLARLVPPSVANSVTQYHITSTAGTFCYIDPEYQQTGMLGVKSDVYSLGVMLLQIITARPPMALTHHVQEAIEEGTFSEILDPAVLDWPIEEALKFAKLALQCAEMRRKDRPDLGKVVLPELNRLRALTDGCMTPFMRGGTVVYTPRHDEMLNRDLSQPGSDSSRNQSNTSSSAGRLSDVRH